MISIKKQTERGKSVNKRKNLNLDPLSSVSNHTQVPALLTFAVASNTEVLNTIIKRVRAGGGDGEKEKAGRSLAAVPFRGFFSEISKKKKNFYLFFKKKHAYVVYPPEGPRPPSPEAVHALAKAERERDQKIAAAAAAAAKK